MSSIVGSVLDLTYRNLTAGLETTKNIPVLSFEDFQKSDFYKPVFNKVSVDDLQRFGRNLINTPIFHQKGLNLL